MSPMLRPSRERRRAGLFLAAILLSGLAGQGCAEYVRRPLPAPFPATRGGTPVPGKGAGLGLELGDALQGQELQRKQIVAGRLLIGIADRVSLSAASYGGHEDRDPSGSLLSGKVRLGSLLGRRTSTALHLGLASMSRSDGPAQDESLTAEDFALPTELLLGPLVGSSHFSLYAGPRLMHESYHDRLHPGTSVDTWMPGVLGGAHLQLGGVVHLFAESTVAWRPATRYNDFRYPGGAIFLPSGSIVAFLGSPFPWEH